MFTHLCSTVSLVFSTLSHTHKKEMNIYRQLPWWASYIAFIFLFNWNRLVGLIICRILQMRTSGLRFSSLLVRRQLGSEGLTPRCTSQCTQTELCWKALRSNNLGTYCMLELLLRDLRYQLTGESLSKVKRFLKIDLLSFSSPVHTHKISIFCVSQETH